MTEETEVRVDELLQSIRREFYGKTPPKKFFEDRTVLIRAIAWPAAWLKERGITWPADRYFTMIKTRLADIRKHGATGEIKSFAGYFMYVVQDHFRHSSETYCQEGKAATHAWEMALGRVAKQAGTADRRAAEVFIDTMAEANRILYVGRPRPKAQKPKLSPPVPENDQLTLL